MFIFISSNLSTTIAGTFRPKCASVILGIKLVWLKCGVISTLMRSVTKMKMDKERESPHIVGYFLNLYPKILHDFHAYSTLL